MIVLWLVFAGVVMPFQKESEAMVAALAQKDARVIAVKCDISCPAPSSPFQTQGFINAGFSTTNAVMPISPPAPVAYVNGCRLVELEITETKPQKVFSEKKS